MISGWRGTWESPVPREDPLILLPTILKREVGPGDPAAHRTGCLPLLPSGPGGVHRVPLHRAQPLFSYETRRIIIHHTTVSVHSHEYAMVKRSEPNIRSVIWRRGWDSNPRSRCRDACFPSMSIRPLSHLSASRSTRVGILACVCIASKANGSRGICWS
jgi:hypothetical protein